MSFHFSRRSLEHLEVTSPCPLHPTLKDIAFYALNITEVDFGVIDTSRHVWEQQELIAKGLSWTMNSKHLKQEDGYSHALDVVAYIGSRVSWKMEHYAVIAEAFLKAAEEHKAVLTWGAIWDRPLHLLDLHDGLENDIDAYVERFRAKYGRRPHLDGPHFQIEL